MSTFNLTLGNTPDAAIIGIASAVPIFPIMLLVFSWFMIFLGGVQRQSRKSGYADLPQWATMASLGCVLLSLIMSIKEGFITLPTLVIVFSITILSAIWMFLSRGRFEQ